MLELITELQAIAQAGITYSTNPFDIARFKRVMEISASLLSTRSNHKFEDILELFTKEPGYFTPKVAVRAAVFREGKILLVRETTDNLWSLPGGWADVNLSPAENCLKEIKEETGFTCTISKLIGIFDKKKATQVTKWPYVYSIFFLCEIEQDAGSYDQNEVSEIGFFSLDSLPALSTGRVTRAQIEKCFTHYHNRSLPAEFD